MLRKLDLQKKKFICFAENICSKLSEVHISFKGHRLTSVANSISSC